MMKMDFVSNILSEIDNAESITMESMINVFDSMLNEYDKMLNHQTCYVEGFVQEAAKKESIMDQATGAGKNENAIVKIIAFLPRLIIAMLKKVASFFTKDKEKELKDAPGKLKTTVENSSDEELKQKGDKLSKETDGIVNVHPKRKNFLVRGFRHVKNAIMLATTMPELLRLIKQAFQKKTFSWSQLSKDIGTFYTNKGDIVKLLNEGKTPEQIAAQLKDYAADEVSCLEMADLLRVINKSGFALSAIADEAELTFNKIAVKRDKAGLDPSEAMAAEKVAGYVKNGAAALSIAMRIGRGIFGFISNPSDIKKAFRKRDETLKLNHDNREDQFTRFKNSPEGNAYKKFTSYDDCVSGLREGRIKKGSKLKDFEKAFADWIAANDDEHIKLPSQGNIDKAKEQSKYKLITDNDPPSDWDTDKVFYTKNASDGTFKEVEFKDNLGNAKFITYEPGKYYTKED